MCGFLDVEALDSCAQVHRIMTHLLPLVNSFPWAGGTVSSDLYSVSLQLYTLRRHSHTVADPIKSGSPTFGLGAGRGA